MLDANAASSFAAAGDSLDASTATFTDPATPMATVPARDSERFTAMRVKNPGLNSPAAFWARREFASEFAAVSSVTLSSRV
jgi:hypothetical protein